MTTPEPLADVADLQALMQRDLTEKEGQRATQLLLRAQALLMARAPWIQARLDDGKLGKMAVATVLANAVKRVLLNPTGAVAITTGPYSRTMQTRNPGVGNDGALVITDADITALTSAMTRGSVGSIKLVPALGPAYALDTSGQLVQAGLRGYPAGLSGVQGAPE